MCEEEQTVVVDSETKVEIKEDVDNDNWKKSLTDVLLEAAESRPIIKPDIKLLQKERETEIKDIVKRFQKLRAEKKSYESVLEQRRESIKQKQAALETQNVRNTDLQGEISEVKSKLLKRGNLIYPANEFFASMGIRYEVSSSDDPFYKCHMKLSISKIEPEPDRIFQVTFAYSTAKIEVLSVDPDELLDKVSDIAMEINGRLVNGKINSLLLLHELRTAFAGYLTQ